VIICGETGTGKEVLARAIHGHSRRQGPFVPVDCTSLSPSLVESELFGHRRGAFSGAAVAREGLFASADGGTILLDEIVDLTLEAQAKLLRVLQTGLVRAVGSDEAVPVDVRVLAASPIPLGEAVRQGRFRLDLHARLAGREVFIPPLRARRGQILRLFGELARENGAELALTQEAAERLLLHGWPQNVRELEMLVKRAVEDIAVSDDRRQVVTASALGELWGGTRSQVQEVRARASVPKRQARVGREALEAALEAHSWNVSRTAKALGRRREQLHRWMKAYGLERGAS
jgi:transcriptional regulator with GAF, ATPase, and Fis domain